MSAIQLAAALVAARHKQDTVQQALIEGIHGITDQTEREELLVEALGTVVGLLHAVGHMSPQATIMLEVFSRIPDLVESQDLPDVFVVKVEDVDHDTTVQLFHDITEGTIRDDRVWNLRDLPGGIPAVVLEGTGIKARYIAVLGATHDQANTLRGELAAHDGR